MMAELVETEKTYVSKLDACISGYMAEMQSPTLPETLKGKEKIIFGNLKPLCMFHKDVFLVALEEARSLDAVARCFIDHVRGVALSCDLMPASCDLMSVVSEGCGTVM